MDIRVLTPSDAAEYRALRLRALKENPEAFGTTYEETVNNPNGLEETKKRLEESPHNITLGAFNDDHKLVGMATLMREQRPKTTHKANVYAVFVPVEERGKGISKKLMVELIEKAKKMDGLEQINLTVVAENDIAQKLYESLGFVTYGTEKNGFKYNGQYWDEHLMVLPLHLKNS